MLNNFKIPKIRDKKFRKWAASFPCLRCNLVGRSQAAHFEKASWGKRGCDSSCRPLCADNFGYVGCHSKMDQSLDAFWTREKRQAVLDSPVYEAWKAGNLDKAIELMGEWRND